MWSALHWSLLAVREANEYAREFGNPGTADPLKLPNRTSAEQQQEEDMFLFQRPDRSASYVDGLLVVCYWTRCAVLSMAGRNLDALEAARLALGSATRAEDHKLAARLTRLVSDVEKDLAEEDDEESEEND